MISGKIDTHHHFLPRPYREAGILGPSRPGNKVPEWSPERAVEVLDAHGIEEAILSIPFAPQGDNAAALVRECNEAAADLRARYPGRFGHFATLPLPDIDASLREAAYCREQLNVDGFLVLCRYGTDYLGDAAFDPLLEELDRQSAVVFTHPQVHGSFPVAAPAVLEYPFDTTRMATNLILKGALRRFANIRFILSHAGGTLPYLFPRIELAVSVIPSATERVGDVGSAFRSFYYDTALAAHPGTMAALRAVADPARILFGTDWPMAPEAITPSCESVEAMCEAGVLTSGTLRDNAAQLLGRK